MSVINCRVIKCPVAYTVHHFLSASLTGCIIFSDQNDACVIRVDGTAVVVDTV